MNYVYSIYYLGADRVPSFKCEKHYKSLGTFVTIEMSALWNSQRIFNAKLYARRVYAIRNSET